MTTSTTRKTTRTRNPIPKPPIKQRIAVKAPPVRDAEAMSTFGNKLTAAADANPALFVSPPYVPQLKTGVAALANAIVAAQGGTDAALSAVLTASSKVHDLIKQHAAWVQAGANNLAPADAATFITTAGFQVARKGQRVALTSPEVTNGTPTVVHFALPPTPGAIMWFTEVSTDGGKTYVRSVDTEHLKGDITGLVSGQSVFVRVRAYVRGSGYTAWTTLPIVVT